MANLSFIFGILGNIISILVFASPIKTFWRIVKKKSTESYKGIPYVTTLLSTSLWTFYGVLKPGGLLVATVNGAGSVFQFIYVTLFLIYAPMTKKVKTAKLVAILDVGFFGAVVAITLLAMHGKMRFKFVGILCAVLNIGMYAAPLAVMRTVIKTKSVEYMPFLLSFFLFLNGGIWSAYAVLVKDLYIGHLVFIAYSFTGALIWANRVQKTQDWDERIPNAIGFVLGAIQLVVYAIYKNKSEKTTKPMEGKEAEKEGSAYKEGIEMNAASDEKDSHRDEEEGNVKNRSLTKETSLPLPKRSVSRQYSLQKLVKTLSLTELNSSWANID